MLSGPEPNPTEAVRENVPACHHHWVIEVPNGPVSQGVCQICQETREFKNSIGWEFGSRKAGRPSSS